MQHKILKFFLFCLIILFAFIKSEPVKAYAVSTWFGAWSNDATRWYVSWAYLSTTTCSTCAYGYKIKYGPFNNLMNAHDLSGSTWTFHVKVGDFAPSAGEQIGWHTACVDPTTPVSTYRDPEYPGYYDTWLEAGCHYGVKNSIYAGCYNSNTGSVDYGDITAGAQCPYRDINLSYCTKGGITAYPTSCAASYCSGCTYYNKTCSGTSCSHPSTAYSVNCGSSSTCTPPPPNISATTSCPSGSTTSNIVANWNDVSYATDYDFRYRVSGGTWSSIVNLSGSTTSRTLTGLTPSTSYEVAVRAHTPNGVWGPTAWDTATITTASCGSIISGNVYVDSDNDGVKNSNYTGGTTMTLSNGATDVTDGSGNYSFTRVLAGTYTVSLPASITGYYIPTRTSASLTVPGDKTYNFRLVPLTTLTIHTYNDFNGNGVEDASDTPSSGRTVTITGGGAGTYTTNTSGNVVLSNLLPNNSIITVSVPSGWTSTTTNPRGITYPPTPLTTNFGIKPPAPTCSGGLTANPTSVSPGGTSILTASGCTSPTGGTINYTYYDDSTIAGDTVTNNNTNTSTFTAPNPWWTQVVAHPSVAVCNPGGGACSNYQTAITIVPKFSISGNVFVDQNKDGLKNGTDANYSSGTSTVQIRTGSCGGPLVYTASTANGIYTTGLNLPGGTYYVCYTSLPVGYKMTNPVNGPPASFSVRVGNASTGGVCSESSNSATCDANGNITNLNYGITNSIPWIQTTGGDPYSSNGISNPIPSGASCGPYMSLRGPGGSPGIVYIGNGSADLGAGQASQNPYNWIAGGLTYPEVYTPKNAELKTSYNTMYNTALRSGITPTPLGTTQCGIGGTTNCALSGTLANGVYIVTNGSLTLTGGSYTFPANKDFVILVNGDLNINTEIHVPIGSSALFSVTGNINVANNVGEAVITSTRANVEGYYSADRNFYAKSLDANGNGANCPTSDRRLNIAGSVVVNAKLQGGSFVNQRDLCAGDLQCPASTVIERPDFILNAPDFLKTTRRVWQEIAP